MKASHVPRLNGLYWATLSLASVFGTNTGDILSHTLRLGDDKGLPILAVMFACVLVAEHRARLPTTIYYWLAVIVLRTAATNIADLATLQLELDYQKVLVGIAALLAAIVVAGRSFLIAGNPAGSGWVLPNIPSTSGVYWFAMLAAAVIGTVLGDFGSHTVTLRISSVLTVALLSVALSLVGGSTPATFAYWVTIVIARAAGTNIGDLLAFRKGLNLGLPISTLLTGALFFGVVMLGDQYSRSPRRSAGPPVASRP